VEQLECDYLSSLLAEKYANILTMKEFVELYKKLEETLGNRSLAARKCGIERRTIYGWDLTKEIRVKTRERILLALLEEMTEDTLDFLTKKNLESLRDVLHTYLSSIYEQAMSEEISNQEYERLAIKLDKIKKEYEGIIDDNLESEIGGMMQYTLTHAQELGLKIKQTPREILRISQFSRIMPDLIKTISVFTPCYPIDGIASQFTLPVGFVSTLSAALQDNYIAIRAIEPIERMLSSVSDNQQVSTVATLTPRTDNHVIFSEPAQLFAIGGAT
jgi:hypothetical protein